MPVLVQFTLNAFAFFVCASVLLSDLGRGRLCRNALGTRPVCAPEDVDSSHSVLAMTTIDLCLIHRSHVGRDWRLDWLGLHLVEREDRLERSDQLLSLSGLGCLGKLTLARRDCRLGRR